MGISVLLAEILYLIDYRGNVKTLFGWTFIDITGIWRLWAMLNFRYELWLIYLHALILCVWLCLVFNLYHRCRDDRENQLAILVCISYIFSLRDYCALFENLFRPQILFEETFIFHWCVSGRVDHVTEIQRLALLVIYSIWLRQSHYYSTASIGIFPRVRTCSYNSWQFNLGLLRCRWLWWEYDFIYSLSLIDYISIVLVLNIR
jgi:hypothetical protein